MIIILFINRLFIEIKKTNQKGAHKSSLNIIFKFYFALRFWAGCSISSISISKNSNYSSISLSISNHLAKFLSNPFEIVSISSSWSSLSFSNASSFSNSNDKIFVSVSITLYLKMN